MLTLNFVYSYEMWGQRTKSSVTAPATATWKEVLDEQRKFSFGQNLKAVRREWETWAWPGGYPIYYVTKDCGVLCPKCANKNLTQTLDKEDAQFYITHADVNYEDPHLYCDHCNKRIESAYAEDEEEETP